MSLGPDSRPRSLALDAGVAGLLTAGAALLARLALTDAQLDAGFLFGDRGHNLLIAQTLLSGGRLYRDVFSQYGPVPAHAHAAFAAVFGNTPTTYLTFAAFFSCLNVPLAYALARRAAGVPVAAGVTLAFLTLSLVPGSLVGGYTDAAYISIERSVLLLVALGWRVPDGRSVSRSLWLGCLLGVWQGVRFGGTFFAGAAILLLDGLYVHGVGWSADRGRAWMRSLAVVLAAFAAVEAVWAVLVFSTLDPALAIDVLWPRYMLRQYESWVTSDLRWIQWEGWRAMVAQYLLAAVAGALGIVAVGCWWVDLSTPGRARMGPRTPDTAAVFVPLCFFVLALFTYFRMVHHFRQFAWTLVPAAAWGLERWGGAIRATVGALWAPGVAVFLKSVLMPAAAGPLMAVVLPAGGTLHLSPDIVERVEFLRRFINTETPGVPVLFVGSRSGSGWVHAYRVPHATRHTWIWAPEILRPYEEETFIRALDLTAALIECDGNGLGESPPLPFPPAVAAAIRSRLRPWTQGAGCRTYHLQRPR